MFQHDVDIDDLVFQDDEVIDAKWVTFSVFNSMFNAGQVVPTLGYFKDLYDGWVSLDKVNLQSLILNKIKLFNF